MAVHLEFATGLEIFQQTWQKTMLHGIIFRGHARRIIEARAGISGDPEQRGERWHA